MAPGESTAESTHCFECGSALSDARCARCGLANRAGRWVVKAVLGRTPHSRVYLAEDAGGRRVALKELLFSTVPGVAELEAFEREAAILAAVDHPRVPRFVESFRDGEGPALRLYLAQEAVEGETLADVIRRGPVDTAAAIDVAGQVLATLAELHERKPAVLHRDLKPSNLVRRPDGTIVLVDFGAARLLDRDATHRSTLVGTFGYMPPEQLAGTIDATSDVYALGATLLHLLTGRPPAELADETLDLGAEKHVTSPAPFAAWLARVCARRRDRRFGSARDALEALRRLGPAGGEALPAVAGDVRLAPTWTREIAAGAGVVLVSTVAFLVVTDPSSPSPAPPARSRPVTTAPRPVVPAIELPAEEAVAARRALAPLPPSTPPGEPYVFEPMVRGEGRDILGRPEVVLTVERVSVGAVRDGIVRVEATFAIESKKPTERDWRGRRSPRWVHFSPLSAQKLMIGSGQSLEMKGLTAKHVLVFEVLADRSRVGWTMSPTGLPSMRVVLDLAARTAEVVQGY